MTDYIKRLKLYEVTTDYSTEISAANNILHYSTVQYSTDTRSFTH